MTNLQNYSLRELISLDQGITLFAFCTSMHDNSYLSTDDWAKMHEVFKFQRQIQEVIQNRIPQKIQEFGFDPEVLNQIINSEN